MTKRFSLPTALAVAFLGVGCSGSSPKPADAGLADAGLTDAGLADAGLADAGNLNVLLDDGGCGCSAACTNSGGRCFPEQVEDGGDVCACEQPI